jgi:predicted amidohydrolase YtcJ
MSRPTSILLYGGNIRTLDEADRTASAIAVSQGQIVALGSDDAVRSAATDTVAAYDLRGRAVVPGFIDPHVHMKQAYKFDRDLEKVENKQDLLDRIGKRCAGSNTQDWFVISCSINRPDQWPNASDLDTISGGRPIFLSLSGHVYATNSAGLQAAGITRDTPDPVGGRIERDAASGEPNGVLMDTARFLVMKTIENAGGDVTPMEDRILFALGELARSGITTAHDMVETGGDIVTYQHLLRDDKLTACMHLLLRVYEGTIKLDSILELGLLQGFGGDLLKFGGVKASLDGQFPSRGSYMTEPYEGTNGRGVLRIDQDLLTEMVVAAHAGGVRFCVHSVGDRSTDLVLDAFAAARKNRPDIHLRHRIEHGGNILCSDAVIARMKDLEVISVPNPSFLRSRGALVGPWLGEMRGRRVVNVKDIMAGGAQIAVASDWPGLRYLSPLVGMEALVTRETADGIAIAKDQAIDVQTALRLYTVNNAYASYEEDLKGTLEIGKAGDMVVLDDDPLTVAPTSIGSIGIEATISRGRIVHAASGSGLNV